MADFLFSIDKAIFYFLNGTLGNPVFDVVMPFLTDLNKTLFGKLLAVSLWVLLMVKGGKKGRVVAVFLIPLIFLSDQMNSSLLKKLIERPRPCHEVDGTVVLANIRLLVDCGSGYSFPSSHAVNNIAAAAYFSYFYRKWTWAFFTFAGLVALSRVFVGVHYPSDIAGGALVGAVCAAVIIGIWKAAALRVPWLQIEIESVKQTEVP